jgi:hypothetical protein
MQRQKAQGKSDFAAEKRFTVVADLPIATISRRRAEHNGPCLYTTSTGTALANTSGDVLQHYRLCTSRNTNFQIGIARCYDPGSRAASTSFHYPFSHSTLKLGRS